MRCLQLRTYTSRCALPATIKQILSSPTTSSQTTTVHGWIRSVRPHKNVVFLDVNDGTTPKGLQAVLHPQQQERLNTGASVRLTGHLVQSRGMEQEKEMRVERVEVLGECDSETYPIQKKTLPIDLLRDNAHLRPRTANIAAMLRVRDKLSRAFADWFENESFVSAHVPCITSIDCEGAGEAFRVVSDVPSSENPPSPPTYLTTSTQLHLEALTAALSRVYTLAPSFRAERSQTNRHLSEFWMLEAEMSFVSQLDVICDVVETSLKGVLGGLRGDEDVMMLRGYDSGEDGWDQWMDPGKKWKRLTYTEALGLLRAHHKSEIEPRFEFTPPEWGGAFRSEHERWIAHSLGGSTGGPVFVTDYPRALKPFYMWLNRRDEAGRETVACFDLLVPRVGEVAGGSVRESRLDMLQESMSARDMDENQHAWYLDLRKYGTTPHGGFGIGFDRIMSWFTGIESVRECVAFPRWAGRVLL